MTQKQSTLDNILIRADQWLREAYMISAEQLGLFRIVFCLTSIFVLGIPNYLWLGDVPGYLFSPPLISFSSLFNGFPPSWFFICVTSLLWICYIFLLFGYKTKLVSVAITVLHLVGNSFVFSFGKIDHSILLDILPFVLAGSGWGNSFSIDEKRNEISQNSPWTVTLMALMVSFGLFTAGFQKVAGGWLNTSVSSSYFSFISGFFKLDRDAFFAPYLSTYTNAFFWESADYMAVFLELLFLILFFFPSKFRVFLILVSLFHLLNVLMFNISFSGYLLIYSLFLFWNFNPKKLENYIFNLLNFRSVAIAIAIALSYLFFVNSISELPFRYRPSVINLFVSQLFNEYQLYTGLIICITFFILILRQKINIRPVKSNAIISED